ncbi:hypothetical protein ONZ51_g6957 [Trametes cubensis]|uniref:Uncharacterized protein n=1 Tax=Trametes cubensis TaxID=1111947 RepID=A0AAD7XA18_9APHY|nr:hypothetical protein ONZ51_g6957 [Trametes cubensis]
MSFARSLMVGSAHSTPRATKPIEEPVVRRHGEPNQVWTYTPTIISPADRGIDQPSRAGNGHDIQDSGTGATRANLAEGPHTGPVYYISLLQQCITSPANVITRSVTAMEHHWAMRATRAEAMYAAQTDRQREISTLSASMEERRARDMAELNARFSDQFAKHQQMMWMILGTMISVVATLMYLLVRTCAPAASSSRWLPPLHFTIPVLSPFASVVEHETSAVNVPLVALLLLGAGSFAFLWFRCGLRR